MSDLQVRGYIVTNSINFLRDNLPADEWKRVSTDWSPDLRRLVGSDVKPADWYPVALMTEINRSIATTLGKGEDEGAREALYKCGKFVATEATNTFLKLLMKMLTPNIFIKKLPDVFKRDFTRGRLVAGLNGQTLTCSYYDLEGYDHIVVTASGFAAMALEAMGKTIESVKVNNWSLRTPYVEGASFDMTWRD